MFIRVTTISEDYCTFGPESAIDVRVADGRHFENRKCTITRPRIVQSLHDDVAIGTNLNFSQKLRKCENRRWQTAAVLKIENT